MSKENCPICNEETISPWAWLYAHWPFYVICSKCNTKLRASVKRSHDVLAQIMAQFIFWAFLLWGLNGNYWLIPVGISLCIFTMILPSYFSDLKRSI